MVKMVKMVMEEDFASVVPGSCDSLSLPSEPPDIRNWFSTYVYESPPLDSLATKSENQVDQFSVEMTDKENTSIKLGSDIDYEHQNTRLSQNPDEPLSEPLPSEPPDIGNWFSGYVYDSPLLDTSDGLELLLPTESQRIMNKNEIDNETVSAMEFANEAVPSPKATDLSHSSSLLSEPPNLRIWFSSYEYESPRLLETQELGFASPDEDELIIEESDTEDENSSGIFRKTKNKGQINRYKEITSTDKQFKESSEVKDLEALLKQESNFSHGSFPCEPRLICINSPCNSKLLPSLNRESSLHELKPQPLEEDVAMNTRQESSTEAALKARRVENSESRTSGSGNKENVESEMTETGYLTTKKGRFGEERVRVSGTKPDGGIMVECSRSKRREKLSDKEDKETKKRRRRVLGETTNLQCSRESKEMIGKWLCPQKNKPDLGPPLKQLRLDAWLHRR